MAMPDNINERMRNSYFDRGDNTTGLYISGYDEDIGATSVFDVNPVNMQYSGEVLADVTNGTDGTYYYYMDMSGYRELGAQLTLNSGSGSVTVTVEGTMQDDGTSAGSCTYIDITSDLYGSSSFTSDSMLLDTGKLAGQFKFIRFKVVASTGGVNDADWRIDIKKLY